MFIEEYITVEFENGNKYSFEKGDMLKNIAYNWLCPPKDFCSDVLYQPVKNKFLGCHAPYISLNDFEEIKQTPSQRQALAELFMKLWKIIQKGTSC